MSDDEENPYVKLISAEGLEFYMNKEIACSASETLKAMLEGNFRESNDNTIRFPDISSNILEKVIQYMYFKDANRRTKGTIPQFKIEPEIALELLVASNYLNC